MGRSVWLAIGASSGLISVAAGAFGAHALKARLSPDLLQIFETGARYQMMHALLLCVVGALAGALADAGRGSSGLLTACGALLVMGTVLFSGSLYVLALSGQRWLGAVTPLGGLCFMAAWALLAYGALRGLAPRL
ncbi:MAG: DUF423 domain-containing protein [Polyangia bacterium]